MTDDARRRHVQGEWDKAWPEGASDDSGYTLDGVVTGAKVTREAVIDALVKWMAKTGSSRLGRSFSVSQSDGKEAFAAYLIDGDGQAKGPVCAILAEVGYEIVDVA